MDKDLPCYALEIIEFCYSKKSSLSKVFDRTKLHKKGSRNIYPFFTSESYRDFEINILVLR